MLYTPFFLFIAHIIDISDSVYNELAGQYWYEKAILIFFAIFCGGMINGITNVDTVYDNYNTMILNVTSTNNVYSQLQIGFTDILVNSGYSVPLINSIMYTLFIFLGFQYTWWKWIKPIVENTSSDWSSIREDIINE